MTSPRQPSPGTQVKDPVILRGTGLVAGGKNGIVSGSCDAIELKVRLKASAEQVRRRLLEANVDPNLSDDCEALLANLDSFLDACPQSRKALGTAPVAEDTRQPQKEGVPQQACSGCRLRSCLTHRNTTTDELSKAIGGVESFVAQAKRELGNQKLRERRAAAEKLHNAMCSGREEALEEAIALARRVEGDMDDIEKAEAKLFDLRSMTPEQKAAKRAHELEIQNKKDAFVLVKKDDADGLEACLGNLDPSVRWMDWKDYAGRTLWKCANDLRATRSIAYLAPILGHPMPGERRSRPSITPAAVPSAPREEPRRVTDRRVEELTAISPRSSPITQNDACQAATPVNTPVHVAQVECASPSTVEAPSQKKIASPLPSLSRLSTVTIDSVTSPTASTSSPVRLHTNGGDEYADLRAKALRAVAKDDSDTLHQVLENVDMDIWSKWQNKAGKDLLTLSQERGSSLAYSVVARALGMLEELQRHSYVEREVVWVFEVGEVQPRRATVLEDTPEDREDILVEFWDGNAPPVHVERCLVRKTC